MNIFLDGDIFEEFFNFNLKKHLIVTLFLYPASHGLQASFTVFNRFCFESCRGLSLSRLIADIPVCFNL